MKLFYHLIGFIASIATNFYMAWTASKMWTWFITPWSGAASPPVLQLWGAMLFIFMLASVIGTTNTAVSDFIKEHELDASLAQLGRACFNAALVTLFLIDAALLHWVSGLL